MKITISDGAEILIDECDLEEISKNKWKLTSKGYVARSGKKSFERDIWFMIHRVILERKLGRPIYNKMVCNHKNHNKLDNRRDNLEEVTNSINNLKRKGPQKNNKSTGYLNIYKIKAPSPYKVAINFSGKKYSNTYKTLDLAIVERNKLRRRLGLDVPKNG